MSITALTFLLLYLGGLGAALVRHPLFGVYAYMLAFYMDAPHRWWGASLPDLRWSFLAALVTLVSVLRFPRQADRARWYATGIGKILIGYMLWMWIQSIWAISPSTHLDGCLLITKYVILFAILYETLSDETSIVNFLLAHVAGCFYLGFLAWQAPVSGRLEGIGGPGIDDANSLAMHLSSGLVTASFLFLILRGFRKWAVIVAIPFILNGVILTESRGALVSLGGTGMFLVLLKPKAYAKVFYLAGGLALVLLVYLSNGQYWSRMQTLETVTGSETELHSSMAGRVLIFQANMSMFRDHPLGVGYRGNVALSRHYMPEGLMSNIGVRSAHNSMAAALVDHGIIGGMLYAAMMFWTVRALLSLKRLDRYGLPANVGGLRAGVGGGLVVAFFAGLFSNFLFAEVQIWLLAVLASVCSAFIPQYEACSNNSQAVDAGMCFMVIPKGWRR